MSRVAVPMKQSIGLAVAQERFEDILTGSRGTQWYQSSSKKFRVDNNVRSSLQETVTIEPAKSIDSRKDFVEHHWKP
jgi:hypothetical protein